MGPASADQGSVIIQLIAYSTIQCFAAIGSRGAGLLVGGTHRASSAGSGREPRVDAAHEDIGAFDAQIEFAKRIVGGEESPAR